MLSHMAAFVVAAIVTVPAVIAVMMTLGMLCLVVAITVPTNIGMTI